MGLLLLIVILAMIGGFLGGLLEFAAWAIVVLALVGAAVGFVAHRVFQNLKGKMT